MLVRINGLPIIDEQEKLFQEVSESFTQFIDEYRKKHWFKELIYGFTGGEDLVDMDRIKAMLWYWELRITLKALRISFRLSPPSEDQSEAMLEALEELRNKLGGREYLCQTPDYSCGSEIVDCPYNGKFNNACYYIGSNLEEYLEYTLGESPRAGCGNPFVSAVNNWRSKEGIR